MKLSISYCKLKYYNINNISQWIFMFKKRKYLNGFIMRIFGVYFNYHDNTLFYANKKFLKKNRCKVYNYLL
jgi:hypothetical protein